MGLIFDKIFDFCNEPNSKAGIEIMTDAESTRQTYERNLQLVIDYSIYANKPKMQQFYEKTAPVDDWVDQCYQEIGAENDCQKCREKYEKEIKPEFYPEGYYKTFEDDVAKNLQMISQMIGTIDWG